MTDHLTDAADLVRDCIERLEKATGPDRELDRLIALAVDRSIWEIETARHMVAEGRQLDYLPTTDGRRLQALCVADHWIYPEATASLDAALTLVPEGYYADMKAAPHRKGATALVWHNTEKNGHGDGPTYAIALCIAALKARLP